MNRQSIVNALSCQEPLAFRDGQITLPDRPGLGLEIDEKALAKAVVS